MMQAIEIIIFFTFLYFSHEKSIVIKTILC